MRPCKSLARLWRPLLVITLPILVRGEVAIEAAKMIGLSDVCREEDEAEKLRAD